MDRRPTWHYEYYHKNIEKRRRQARECYHRKKTEQPILFKEYIEKVRDYRVGYLRRRRSVYRMQLFDLLGNKCIICGFSDIRALEFDHIDHTGYLDRKIHHGSEWGRYYALYPEEAKQKLQILCCNCNRIKKIEYLKKMTI